MKSQDIISKADRYFQNKDYRKAFELYKLVDEELDDPIIYRQLAMAKYYIYDFLQSLSYIDKALNKSPNYENLILKASILFSLKRFDEAILYVNKARKISTSGKDIKLLANIYRQKGDLKLASQEYTKLLNKSKSNTDAYYPLALIHNFTDKNDSLLKFYLDSLNSLDGHDKAKCLFSLGKAYDDLRDYELAYNYIIQANYIMNQLYAKEKSEHLKQNKILCNNLKSMLYPRYSLSYKQKYKPLFIIGMSRSGKSFLENAISFNHVESYGEDEILLNKIKEICVDKYNSNTLEFLSKVTPREAVDIMHNYFNCFNGSNMKIHSGPGLFVLCGFLLDSCDCKIIYINRDIKECVIDSYFKYYAKGNLYSYSIDTLVDYYLEYDAVMKHWMKKYPNKILKIGYEDLVSNTVGTIDSISKYLGIPCDFNIEVHKTSLFENYKKYFPELIIN